ncbi:M48 family metalloprotease [Arenimonas fontis]|uniref:Putative beta-barrel assembly-enhancing protease n=1 Tax=Arenimonas fontis TaxID=2608255 RepID=A0A5B2ZES6_9GAMM|nr:M48 family metalloprotease [Arenimonas fontis]KAA2285582.1 M48 family metallopeptidase [Arenimonas fontis]
MLRPDSRPGAPVRIPAALACTVVFALGLARDAHGQDSRLPDIGSSAGEVVDPATEARYGAYVLYELRRMGLVLEDPLLDGWLQGMGYRLVAASDTPNQDFTFFMMRERQINAFATLGGYIGVNSGLVLTAESEGEVASVMAHEIAHVSQQHVLRGIERAKRDQVPILLAMLGAIAASQAINTDSRTDNSRSNASAAAVAGAMALIQQRQIDYTRSNESEADRIGIQTLARAGYPPEAMGDFFERMQRAYRSNSGGYQLPEYLRTHPVTITRISEARQRAAQLAAAGPGASPSPSPGVVSPLLPDRYRLSGAGLGQQSPGDQFEWARERLRVLSASDAKAAVREYEALAGAPGARPSDPRRYGLALARVRAGDPDLAIGEFEELLARHPGHLWIELALAEALARAGREGEATERFERLLRRHTGSRAVRLAYADVLGERGTAASGRRAQEVLRPLLAESGDDPLFQRSFARACELAGDLVRAGEAHAEAAFLTGRAIDALGLLDRLLKEEDLDYYQRARIEARIAAITPYVLEMRRRGIEPGRQPAGP